jgi:hypothetical protein
MIGLDLGDLAVDGCLTVIPGGGEARAARRSTAVSRC